MLSLRPKFSTTDVEGNYRIENVPVGRQTLKVTYIGYEEQTISNIVVTAGKEVVLNFGLRESISQLNEVVIVADTKEDKTATNNDLAVVSARSFNVDDTKRYAGALGDPSRMAANFAGVVGGNDSRNDIVVRGNSPTGMLWQLEGFFSEGPFSEVIILFMVRLISGTFSDDLRQRKFFDCFANQIFNTQKLPLILFINKSDSRAGSFSPGCPADAMNIIFRIGRNIKVDHETDTFNVDSTGKHIGSDDHVYLFVFESS